MHNAHLYKIGTGLNKTIQSKIYKKRSSFFQDETGSTLAFASGKLYFSSLHLSNQGDQGEDKSERPFKIAQIDPYSLEIENTIFLQNTLLLPNESASVLSDGVFLYILYKKSVELKNASPLSQEKFQQNFFLDIYNPNLLSPFAFKTKQLSSPSLLLSIQLLGEKEESSNQLGFFISFFLFFSFIFTIFIYPLLFSFLILHCYSFLYFILFITTLSQFLLIHLFI